MTVSEARLDPRKLHLRKELTQIRKAARVLRDPGTTSSWRSPPPPLTVTTSSSSRSAAVVPLLPPPPAPPATINTTTTTSSTSLQQQQQQRHKPDYYANGGGNSNTRSGGGGGLTQKENRVFLHNWRSSSYCYSTSSEKKGVSATDPARRCATRSLRRGEEANDNDDDGSSVPSSVEDSLSDGRNGGRDDSKSDSYVGGGGGGSRRTFGRRDVNLMRRNAAKAPRRSKHQQHAAVVVRGKKSSSAAANSRRLLLPGDGAAAPSMALGLMSQDESASLIDQSEDTEGYCNSEDIRQISGKFRRKEDSSYTYNSTPALSTSSYNHVCGANRNPSTVGSWEGTTPSLNDGEGWVDEHLDLPGRQGCGIPCYWSKRTPKHRAYGSSSLCSPSFSDTLRRTGSSILCGSHKMYGRRRHGVSSRKLGSRTAQGVLPLLTNGSDGRGGGSSMGSDDELSTNFGELDLEALSRLDGRRWSTSCRSQDPFGLQVLAAGEGEEGSTSDNTRSISQRYRPMFFEELVGQNIVVQSLMNTVTRGRIAPLYLFHGPRGTGKTSAARIFAAALNCMAAEKGSKPCGMCEECTDFVSGKGTHFRVIDGSNKEAVDRVRCLFQNLWSGAKSAFSRYKVFVIEECHLLPSKMWLAFLKFLEEPRAKVVFIFTTTDLDSMPRTVLSRCQKYLFSKIKDCDIVARLKKISDEENLEVESDALDLIALNADGSLRDAETMLDQLSLLGKRITTSLVNELVGVVPDDKLLELLAIALSSDTAETVKRARDLLDSGIDPMVLMSQMASLIMDLIAGTYRIVDTNCSDSLFSGRSLTDTELERLKHALKLLSEAEKQLRVSSERSTWFTATLLRLGSVSSSDFTQSSSSRRQSSKTTEEDLTSASKVIVAQKQNPNSQYMPRKSTSSSSSVPYNGNYTHQGDLLSLDNFNFKSKPTCSLLMDAGTSDVPRTDFVVGNMILSSRDKLDDIWGRCIERCHSKTLRQLLHAHGSLLSISEVEGILIANVAFKDAEIKSRAERFLSSMTDSIETVLRCNIEVRIILLRDGEVTLDSTHSSDGLDLKHRKTVSTYRGGKATCSNIGHGKNIKAGTQDHYIRSPLLVGETFQSIAGSPLSAEDCSENNCMKERRQELPMRRIESIIREQNLETAWLKTTEKNNLGSQSQSKSEKNPVLPRDGMCHHSQLESFCSANLSSGHWAKELDHEIKVIKTNDGNALQKEQNDRRAEHCPMSPSLLHNSSLGSNFTKDNLGYESGYAAGGCSALFCWNNTKHRRRVKVKKVASAQLQKTGHFHWFGECGMLRKRQQI